MASGLITFPGSDLHGTWERSNPKGVTAGSYVQPTVEVVAHDSYAVGDAAASNHRTTGLTIPTLAAARKLLLVTSVTDETTSTALGGGSEPKLPALNQTWTLTSTLGAGTFTLTYNGFTTGALNWNDSAATIQTALRALTSIGSGNATCSGGPLNTTPVTVVLSGSLAATFTTHPLVSSDPSVVVASTSIGGPLKTFTLEQTVNIPWGAGNQPQLHVWSLDVTTDDSTRVLDYYVASHGTLRSWAAVLLATTGLHGTPVPTVALSRGSAASASFPSITPAHDGSLLLALGAKALTTGFYPTSAPTIGSTLGLGDLHGYGQLVGAVGDCTTLQAWLSDLVAASTAVSGPTAYWGDTEDYALVVLELRASTSPTIGSSLWDHSNSTLDDRWIEIASVAGDLYEVVEFDLAGLPAGAVPISVGVEIRQVANVRSNLHAVACGITGGGDIVLAAEGGTFTAETTEQSFTTPVWTTFDGTAVSDFARLGVAIWSDQIPLGLSTHRIFYLRATVTYDFAPTVVVTGPASSGDPITWVYSSPSGKTQSGYEVAVFGGYGADPLTAPDAANPFSPASGDRMWTTGKLAGSAVRSYLPVNYPMARGHHTAAVRAWSLLDTGVEIAGPWATDDFDLGSTASPPSQPHTSAYDGVNTGVVRVPVETASGTTRAWLLVSTDGGATWSVQGPPRAIV